MITITQKCDGCGNSRALRSSLRKTGTMDLRTRSQQDGWLEVGGSDEDVHLCPKCVEAALKKLSSHE